MIARGFKSVIWVAGVGAAALGCYMVSLQVATERNELAKVELRIVEAQRDIRSLQTELGTRGRLSQLEHWNAEVLALSAPRSAQFLPSEFTLARLDRSEATVDERAAEVRLASAETPPAVKPSAPVVPVQAAVAARAPEASTAQVHRASLPAVKPAAVEPKKPGKPQPTEAASAAPRLDSLAEAVGSARDEPAAERSGGN